MAEGTLGNWIVGRDGDGYPGDVTVRVRVDPPGGQADRELTAALLDLGARIGLEARTLPPDLFSTTNQPDAIAPRTAAEVRALLPAPSGDPWDAAPVEAPASDCLTRLFTIDGALEDRDGDQLPDASRIAFEVPDTLPAELAAALANLAARIGLESGGITFPLGREGGARFRVQPGEAPAELRAADGGWTLTGDPAGMTRLVAEIGSAWPHRGAPGAPGAEYALGWLRRGLAGNGPEPGVPGDLAWELKWSAPWEADALLDTFRTEVLPLLSEGGAGPAEIVVFASEPPEVRQGLATTLRAELDAIGMTGARVTVLCAFKAGLSWLREVVIPAAGPLKPSRLKLSYQRHTTEGDLPALDLPIRWLQELFPGPEIIAREIGIPLDAIEVVEAPADAPDIWMAEAFDANGALLHRWAASPLSKVQPWVPDFPDAGTVRVTTGGIDLQRGDTRRLFPVPTDLERFWSFWQHEVVPKVIEEIDRRGGARADLQPFFGALEAEVWISEPNERLGIREENDSAAEALQEEIYFGTLDTIEMLGQRTSGERTGAPGAVIPIVHVAPGSAPHANVRLRYAPEPRDLPRPEVRVAALALVDAAGTLVAEVEARVDGDDTASVSRLPELAELAPATGLAAMVTLGRTQVALRLPLPELLRGDAAPDVPPPMDVNIHGAAVTDWATRLAAFPEIDAWVEDISYEGRPLPALRLSDPAAKGGSATKEAILKPTHIIIARHHANEISSTNAAFRLAWLCATDPAWRRYLERVNVLILPYENPDGAALHARLAADPDARYWKHHPARYNALGAEYGFDHFNPDSPFGESRARGALWRRFPADVLVDNHGVPSHEWVQAFAGFGSPPRFRVSYWVVQALLYGIANVIDDPAFPDSRASVNALRDAVSAKVRDTDIGEWNRIYGQSYRFWGQSREPEHFPGVFHDDMLWHIYDTKPDPQGRNLEQRYPKTTVISWVTEVNDETAEGEHLERVARAHLLSNQATLDLLYAAAPPIRHWRADDGNGRVTLRIGRDRPLRLGASDE